MIQPVLQKPRVGQRLFGFTVLAVRAGFGPRCYEVELRGGRKLTVRVSRPAEPEPPPVPLVTPLSEEEEAAAREAEWDETSYNGL